MLRIIGGEFRSRLLKSVPGDSTRPTPDRLRESLFSILTPDLEGATFVDAYAGTGAVGLEALSRGASKAILIEKDPGAAAICKANIEALKVADRVRLVKARAAAVIADYPVDILFLDPPYPLEKEYALCLNAAQQHGLVIAQHASRFALEETYGALTRYRTLRQGDNTLSFYQRATQP